MLRCAFSPGLWTYWLPLDQIKGHSTVRNHGGSGFWASGRDRVWPAYVSGLFTLSCAEIRRCLGFIGTDDPHGLAAALQTLRGEDAARRSDIQLPGLAAMSQPGPSRFDRATVS